MANYTKMDMDIVSGNSELTEQELREMLPFAQVFPELAATIRVRGNQKALEGEQHDPPLP